jgi:hypothetical protein
LAELVSLIANGDNMWLVSNFELHLEGRCGLKAIHLLAASNLARNAEIQDFGLGRLIGAGCLEGSDAADAGQGTGCIPGFRPDEGVRRATQLDAVEQVIRKTLGVDRSRITRARC